MNDSKKNDQLTDQGPTGLMGTQVALAVAQGVIDACIEANVTKEQMLSWEQETVRLISKEVTQKVLGLSIDPWLKEKQKIERFYKKFFNRVIDWSLVSLPEKCNPFRRIEYIFADITEDQILEAYAKKFGIDSLYKALGSVTEAISEQQFRPAGDRVFAHIGGLEPDLLKKSYDDGISEGIKFMIPREGFIAAFRERTETKKMYDVVGLTRFAALDRSGCAMGMCGGADGRFSVGSSNRDDRSPQCGLRQVSF